MSQDGQGALCIDLFEQCIIEHNAFVFEKPKEVSLQETPLIYIIERPGRYSHCCGLTL